MNTLTSLSSLPPLLGGVNHFTTGPSALSVSSSVSHAPSLADSSVFGYQSMGACSLLPSYSYDVMHRHYRHGYYDNHPLHRLAEDIVAESKPSPSNCSSATSHFLSRQSVIQKSPVPKLFQPAVKVAHLTNGKLARFTASAAIDRRSKKAELSAKEMERKRDLANKQERRRMHRLNDALNRLREVGQLGTQLHHL